MISAKPMDRVSQEITELGISTIVGSGCCCDRRNDLEKKSNFGEGLRKTGRIPIAVPGGVMARPTPSDLCIEVLQYILHNKSYFT